MEWTQTIWPVSTAKMQESKKHPAFMMMERIVKCCQTGILCASMGELIVQTMMPLTLTKQPRLKHMPILLPMVTALSNS